MPAAVSDKENNLTNLQIELLKSMKHTVSEQQLNEIKSLLRFYFAEQLEKAVDKVERERNYSADTYKAWLTSGKTKP